MRYLIEPREQRYVKDYKFLSYAKKSKTGDKYSGKLLKLLRKQE